MNREETLKLLVGVLSEVTGCRSDEISESKSLMGDLGVESIDVVDICFEVEKVIGGNLNLLQAFQVTPFANDRPQQGPTVKDLVEYILNSKET